MSHKIAYLSLDFAGEESVSGSERRCCRWTRTPLKSPSWSISSRCGASIGRAAEACADRQCRERHRGCARRREVGLRGEHVSQCGQHDQPPRQDLTILVSALLDRKSTRLNSN